MSTVSEDIITMGDTNNDFCDQIAEKSGVSLGRCWHCNSCAGGCPFDWAMDYHPNQVIRMVQLGLKHEVLRSSTIWICVGCHSCAVQCPNAIDVAAVMDALREAALAENVVTEPDIYNFHKQVIGSVKRYGRTHKLEIMLRYKLQKRDWLQDMDVGLKMLTKRKLELLPSKVHDINEIKKIFE
jgi:heterodisulfide reductase subunit C